MAGLPVVRLPVPKCEKNDNVSLKRLITDFTWGGEGGTEPSSSQEYGLL